jgi:hypothetical protein
MNIKNTQYNDIITLSIMTFSQMILSIGTLCTMTLSITTLNLTTISRIISNSDTQHNIIHDKRHAILIVVMLIFAFTE